MEGRARVWKGSGMEGIGYRMLMLAVLAHVLTISNSPSQQLLYIINCIAHADYGRARACQWKAPSRPMLVEEEVETLFCEFLTSSVIASGLLPEPCHNSRVQRGQHK